jgi:hypothetical protein
VQADISARGRQVQCQVIDLGSAIKASARKPHLHAILTNLPAMVTVSRKAHLVMFTHVCFNGGSNTLHMLKV